MRTVNVKTLTLFGHLALQFSTHPENVATEALCFILKSSAATSRAFITFIKTSGVELDEPLTYISQPVGLDQSIPDIKCIGKDGSVRVIIENKFWAGLTENQPVTYLRELPDGQPGLVLFVVPEARMKSVWEELLLRCRSAGLETIVIRQMPELWVATVNAKNQLVLTSWSCLLSGLKASTLSAGDMESAASIAQLAGLCEAMDNEAFLPLRPDELTNMELPRRIVNYADLVFDIVAAAELKGYCDRKGCRATPYQYGSGTYLHIAGFTAWFGFNAAAWKRHELSPMWVHFGPDYSPSGPDCSAIVREKLRTWRLSNPPRCFDFEGNVGVPILLQATVEKNRVINYAVGQLGKLRGALQCDAATNAAEA